MKLTGEYYRDAQISAKTVQERFKLLGDWIDSVGNSRPKLLDQSEFI